MSVNLRPPWEHQSNTLHNWSVKLVLFVLTHIWNFSSSISKTWRDMRMATPYGNKNLTIISINSFANNTTHRTLQIPWAREKKTLNYIYVKRKRCLDWCQGLVQSACLTMLLIALIRLCWLRLRSQQSNYPVLFSYKNKMELRFSMRTQNEMHGRGGKKTKRRKTNKFCSDFLFVGSNHSLFVPNGRFSLICKALLRNRNFECILFFRFFAA